MSDTPIGSSVEPIKKKFRAIGAPTCIIFQAYEKSEFQPIGATVTWTPVGGDD